MLAAVTASALERDRSILPFALRRCGRLVLTVLLISTIVFIVIRIIPGDPALVIAGIDASPSDIDAIRARLGTDRPILAQYAAWIWSVIRFDFGDSMISGQPVIRLILERFPLTLSLALMGIVISIVCLGLCGHGLLPGWNGPAQFLAGYLAAAFVLG